MAAAAGPSRRTWHPRPPPVGLPPLGEAGAAEAAAAEAPGGGGGGPAQQPAGPDGCRAPRAPEAAADERRPGEDAAGPHPAVAACRGQARLVTREVVQDPEEPSRFSVDGKDKSWFVQKGAVSFHCRDPSAFSLDLSFLWGARSLFGERYAGLSRQEQESSINWLVAAGAAFEDWELTGYRDCKLAGFFFLLHLNYRRTRWRVVGCPHDCELEDAAGRRYPSGPQQEGLLEVPAREGQRLGVELARGELWLLDDGCPVARGLWAAAGAGGGGLPKARRYCPAVLMPNCPTVLQATVS